MHLVLQMHLTCYPIKLAWVGLVQTLLRGTTLAWFAPLSEKRLCILDHFDKFTKECQTRFKHTRSVRKFINKIQRLWQGDQCHFLVRDIPSYEEALMDQFRQGFHNDMKDPLLTFHDDPKLLTKAISRAVGCDNRLFNRWSKHQPKLSHRWPYSNGVWYIAHHLGPS